MIIHVLTFLFSCLIAWGLLFLTSLCLPYAWVPRSDIIGFPLHQNYNIDRVYLDYFLKILFPFVTFVIFHYTNMFLGISHKRNILSLDFLSKYQKNIKLCNLTTYFLIFLRVSTVGLTLGFALLLFLKRSSSSFLLHSLILVADYYFIIAVFCYLLKKLLKWKFIDVVTTLNFIFIPMTVFLLYAASTNTSVTETNGTVTNFPWCPLWLVCITFLLTEFWVFRSIKNHSFHDKEKKLFFIITIPVLLFISQSYLYGHVGEIDYYHDGTGLTPSALISKGLFPWRDIFIIRGLFEDYLKYALGHKLIQDSFWGAKAGETLFFTPLYWVLLYFLNLKLYPKNLSFVLAVSLLPFMGSKILEMQSARLIFQPIMLLLFLFFLRMPRISTAFLWSFISILQIILVPESMFMTVGCFLIQLLKDFYENREISLTKRFTSFLKIGVFHLFWILIWLIYLERNNAIGPFINYYLTFSGFRYMTAIPLIIKEEIWLTFMIFLPIILFCLVIWYFLFSFFKNRKISPEEWVVASLTFFIICYYQKFLNRMDGHLFAVTSAAFPIAYFIVFKILETLERSKIISITLVSTFFISFLFLKTATKLPEAVSNIPNHFHTQVTQKSKWSKLGYSLPETNQENLLSDFNTLFSSYLDPNDTVFDFTNQSGLFYYTLGIKPASSHHIIYMAMNSGTQSRVIRELKLSQPKLVIFHFNGNQVNWDSVPMMVRHYAISNYLLKNYQPFFKLNQYLIFIRNDLKWKTPQEKNLKLSERTTEINLYFRTDPCNWGFASFYSSQHLNALETKETPMKTAPITLVNLTKSERKNLSYLEIKFKNVESDVYYLSQSKEAKASGNESIRFLTVTGTDVLYRIPVGSCSQWYGYSDGPLYLHHDSPSKIASIQFTD